MEPTHLLTGLGAIETGSKDDHQGRHTTPCMEQTSTNEEVISSSHGTMRDQPTGRGGNPPGLSINSGSSHNQQVSTSEEIVENNHCISLSLPCDEDEEWETCLKVHLELSSTTATPGH